MLRPILELSATRVCQLAVIMACCACAAPAALVPDEPDSTASTEPPAEPDPYVRYDAQALFENEHAFAAGFSHDGQRVLLGSTRSGVMLPYVIAVAGGEAKQVVTASGDSQSPLSFFPHDDRFLLTADQGGNEVSHIYVIGEDGSRHDLIPKPEARGNFFGWAKDGAHFFMLTNERDPRSMDLYRYASDDYQRELVWTNEDIVELAAVSPDGRWAAIEQVVDNRETDTYVLDLSKRKAKPKLITKAKQPAQTHVFTFTHDSAKLIYSTDEHGEFRQAWSYELATGKHELVLASDWDVTWLQYSKQGRYRVAALNVDAKFTVEIRDEQSGAPLVIADLPSGELVSADFSDDERRMLAVIADERRPADTWVVELESGAVTRLTDTLNPAIDVEQLVTSQVVRFPSFDGVEIPALLYRPREAGPQRRVPALLWIHGGPGGQSMRRYDPYIQHLVNHGYAVLAVNNRGSNGYGKTFHHLDDRVHGEADLDDCVAAKTYLQSLDWIDGERIGIMGGSYGGYMVLAALAFRPEVFAVGIDLFGVANWIRTLESIPPWWASFRNSLVTELGDPVADREMLEAKSPLLHPEGIVRPLLVIQGANDPRVLEIESDEIVAAVQARGVPVEYLVFDDEGHGFEKRVNEIAAAEAILRFADQHLRAQSSSSGSSTSSRTSP